MRESGLKSFNTIYYNLTILSLSMRESGLKWIFILVKTSIDIVSLHAREWIEIRTTLRPFFFATCLSPCERVD